jgi:hypothetical protein
VPWTWKRKRVRKHSQSMMGDACGELNAMYSYNRAFASSNIHFGLWLGERCSNAPCSDSQVCYHASHARHRSHGFILSTCNASSSALMPRTAPRSSPSHEHNPSNKKTPKHPHKRNSVFPNRTPPPLSPRLFSPPFPQRQTSPHSVWQDVKVREPPLNHLLTSPARFSTQNPESGLLSSFISL